MIRFHQVTRRYPNGYEALRNVSFELPGGAMTFLTGHSGAGKSTLIRLVALIERCTRGQIIIGGQNLSRIRPRDLPHFRRNIGVVFQDHRMLLDRTVFDNVALPLIIAGYSHRDVARRVRAALNQVSLLGKEKSYPITLSGGEQQRVCIARGVVNKPAILLADEPTGNLDPQLSREIMDLFRRFNEFGVTVLVATHDLGLIRDMRQPVLTLKSGSISDQRPPEDP